MLLQEKKTYGPDNEYVSWNLNLQPQVDGNQVNMVPVIKKIIRSYTTSVWMPFLLVAFFFSIASILVTSGGLHVYSRLCFSTQIFIKLYAFSLLGQLYTSFWHFFKGTKTGTIQVLLLAFSLIISFLTFFFFLVPFWRGFLEV